MVALAPFWAASPTFPNETAPILAAGITTATLVHLSRLADGAIGTPFDTAALPFWFNVPPIIQAVPSGRMLAVTVPGTWAAGIYGARLKNGGTTSATTYLNGPDARWIQGDYGAVLEPGGTLYASGYCLGFNGQSSTMVLCQDGAVVATLTDPTRMAVDRNGVAYCLAFALPADLPDGDYDAYSHNGYGGPGTSGGWRKYGRTITSTVTTVTVAKRTAWPSGVTDFSLMAGADDDARMVAAIAATAAGGVIFFPAGTYHFSNRHALHAKTTLRGASRATTLVLWDIDPGGSGLYGADIGGGNRAAFSTEDISFQMPDASAHRAIEQRFVTEFFWHDRTGFTNALNQCTQSVNDPTGLYLSNCVACRISGCVFDSGGNCIFASNDVAYALVLGCSSTYRGTHIYIGGRCHSWIYDSPTLILNGDNGANDWGSNGNSGGLITGFHAGNIGAPYTQSIMVCRVSESANTTPIDAASKRPGWSLDGMDGVYHGGASSSGTTVTLSGTTRNDTQYNWAGSLLYVAEGTGAGQFVKVTVCANGVGSVTIASALAVDLDETSVIVIISDLSEIFLVGSVLGGSANCTMYEGARDNLIAGCDFGTPGQASTVEILAGTRAGGRCPNTRCQMLNNRVVTGTGTTAQLQVQDFAGDNDTDGLEGFVVRGWRSAGGTVSIRARCLETPVMAIARGVIEDNDGALEFEGGSDGANFDEVFYRSPGGTVHPSPVPPGCMLVSVDQTNATPAPGNVRSITTYGGVVRTEFFP